MLWQVGTLAALQGGLAITALAATASAPPQSGPMLLVSMTGMPPGAILGHVMPAGAMLLEPGPVAGSVIVRGERAAILEAALPFGILAFAASPKTCGEKR